MPAATLVRFLPLGPWRLGPDSGERDGVETVLHSDTLNSSICWAMQRLGLLDQWLEATLAEPAGPAVKFSSGFPFAQDLLFVVPPAGFWPPAPSLRIRWKGARFIPFQAVHALLADEPLSEDQWRVDGASSCLIPSGWSLGPFRPAKRFRAAVDRLSGKVAVHGTGCLEFSPGAGIWAAAIYRDEQAYERWAAPVRAALRLLADSGVGGERSSGWGHSGQPVFTEGSFPELLLAPAADSGAEVGWGWWLLSLYSPSPDDRVNWSRGEYELVLRSGRVIESGGGAVKRQTRMVKEGSVLVCENEPRGFAPVVTPPGCPHPVYRAGFAVSVPVPIREVQR